MRRGPRDATHLLHDAGLPLGESNVPTRLILDKLDLDLAALTTGLVIIIIFIIGAHAVALGATGVGAVAGKVIVTRGKLFIKNRRHIGNKDEQKRFNMGGGGYDLRGGYRKGKARDDPIE